MWILKTISHTVCDTRDIHQPLLGDLHKCFSNFLDYLLGVVVNLWPMQITLLFELFVPFPNFYYSRGFMQMHAMYNCA